MRQWETVLEGADLEDAAVIALAAVLRAAADFVDHQAEGKTLDLLTDGMRAYQAVGAAPLGEPWGDCLVHRDHRGTMNRREKDSLRRVADAHMNWYEDILDEPESAVQARREIERAERVVTALGSRAAA